MTDSDQLRSLIAANALAANDAVASPTPAVLERWVDTFAGDGVFEVEGHCICGGDALIAFHTAVMTRGTPVPQHFVGESCLDVSGDQATGRIDFLLIGADGVAGVGRYDDRYVRGPNGWRIAHRRAGVLGGASADITALASKGAAPAQ